MLICGFRSEDGLTVERRLFDSGAANIETLYEAVLQLKDMADHLINKQIPCAVMYDLVNFNDDVAGGRGGEAGRFDMRIKRGPLASPVTTYVVASLHVTAFHAVGPCNIFVESSQDGFDVPGVEAVVDVLKEFDLGG
jgi:hypothetical protein